MVGVESLDPVLREFTGNAVALAALILHFELKFTEVRSAGSC